MSAIVHSENYRGFEIRITRIDRTDSVLMPVEYLVFIGGDIEVDELETLESAIAIAHQHVNAAIKAVKGN